mmetsp:Transcript_41320/g.90192  ORF Transcript_41320/g.90192 Transcript_41320/m.90192 type:complete len:211 (-) Transcript_41320:1597-2229(-)
MARLHLLACALRAALRHSRHRRRRLLRHHECLRQDRQVAEHRRAHSASPVACRRFSPRDLVDGLRSLHHLRLLGTPRLVLLLHVRSLQRHHALSPPADLLCCPGHLRCRPREPSPDRLLSLHPSQRLPMLPGGIRGGGGGGCRERPEGPQPALLQHLQARGRSCRKLPRELPCASTCQAPGGRCRRGLLRSSLWSVRLASVVAGHAGHAA